MNFGQDFLSIAIVLKIIGIQIRHLGEQKHKLSDENEGARVGIQEIIGVVMSLLGPKRYAKPHKEVSEHIEEQYLRIQINI